MHHIHVEQMSTLREDIIRLNPGIPEHLIPSQEEMDESDRIYRETRDAYKLAHEVCPLCGSNQHRESLVGYAYFSDAPADYQDLNYSICQKCGWHKTVHDRISKIEFETKHHK